MDSAPRCYLSRSEGTWRLILDGMPLCRNGSEADARAALARLANRQFNKIDTSHGWLWDGDAGAFVRDEVKS